MQRVQALTLRTLPLSMARTFCRFGLKTFLVLLWAWLTLQPLIGFLPQTSHTFAMIFFPPVQSNTAF
jgi:hypothetical protein